MNRILALLCCLLVAGCVGGPPKDYYLPVVVGAKFKEPVTMALVNDVTTEEAKLVNQGYTVVGKSTYGGDVPKAVELNAQAKRVGANHVIYSADFVPATPGSWSFGFGRGFGSGGTDKGHASVQIVFLGK